MSLYFTVCLIFMELLNSSTMTLVYIPNIAPHLLEIPFKTISSKMFRCNKTKDSIF